MEFELRAWVGGENFTLTPIGVSREHRNDSGTWVIGTVEEEVETQRRGDRAAVRSAGCSTRSSAPAGETSAAGAGHQPLTARVCPNSGTAIAVVSRS